MSKTYNVKLTEEQYKMILEALTSLADLTFNRLKDLDPDSQDYKDVDDQGNELMGLCVDLLNLVNVTVE